MTGSDVSDGYFDWRRLRWIYVLREPKKKCVRLKATRADSSVEASDNGPSRHTALRLVTSGAS